MAKMMETRIPLSKVVNFAGVGNIYEENFNHVGTHQLIGARLVSNYTIEEMARSIEAEGLWHPILVREHGKGFEIISGHLRKEAFLKLNRSEIEGRVINVCDVEAKAMLITTNRNQHPLSAIEEAWVAEDLLTKEKISIRECARLLNVSASWVCHRRSLVRDLIRSVQIDVLLGLVSAKAAIAIASVHAREQLRISELAKERNLSLREVEDLVRIMRRDDLSDEIKRLALDDPREVIKSIEEKKRITYNKWGELSYFASNFKVELDKLGESLMEVAHRLRRDYSNFSSKDKELLKGDIFLTKRRVEFLQVELEKINGQEFN